MIIIAGKEVPVHELEGKYNLNELEREILNKLSISSERYKYITIKQLKFEINMRVNIVSTARELNETGFEFEVFKKAYCNNDFWNLTKEGGFKIKEGIKPIDAIRDIFINGSKYGTECATAIVIVFYKALANIYPEEIFNDLFQGIYLMDWSYLDDDLGIESTGGIDEFIPGDCVYFENPDVDPETPEWQGENVIDLGGGNYYGHGIGIGDARKMIKELNEHRKKDAKADAFLANSVTQPDFKYLANRYLEYLSLKQRDVLFRRPQSCFGDISFCPFLQRWHQFHFTRFM